MSGMGETTGKYRGMTAEQIAETLSSRMIGALGTGRPSTHSARVLGHTNTIVALMDRGLVHRDQRWTRLGLEVARLVLSGHVYSIDELHEQALAESPEPQLVGKCVRVVGTKAGRGLVVSVTDHGRSVHVQMTDRLVIADPINVSLLDEQESRQVHEQLFAAGKLLSPECECFDPIDVTSCVSDAHRVVEQLSVTPVAAAERLEPPVPARPWHEIDGTPTEVAQALARRLVELLTPAAPEPEQLVPELEEPAVTVERIVRRAQYDALRKMLDVLAGWIEGAQENHEALGHRHENVGDECWQRWHPEDIRRMVVDAARALGTLDPTKAVGDA